MYVLPLDTRSNLSTSCFFKERNCCLLFEKKVRNINIVQQTTVSTIILFILVYVRHHQVAGYCSNIHIWKSKVDI